MRARVLISVALLTAISATAALAGQHDLPNAALTPGAVDPAITQTNIQTTICVPGYTKIVRPPSKYTTDLKRAQLGDPQYKYRDHKLADYEEDHLISLELGGAPRDPRNLWPEPYAGVNGARVKDHIEDRLHRLVCNGTVTLKEAQDAIAHDWVAAYRKYIH